MRLPIYRHLDQRISILGLSPVELGLACSLFVVLNEILTHIAYGGLFTFAFCFGLIASFRYLHRRFDSHYLEKLIRFVSLPDGLGRKIAKPIPPESKDRNEKAYEPNQL